MNPEKENDFSRREAQHEKEAARWRHVSEMLSDDDTIAAFFGLSKKEMINFLSSIVLDDKGTHISPQFQSPGYGDATNMPMIKMSDLDVSEATLLHEAKHGLHFRLCVKLFEAEDSAANFQLFMNHVLGDHDFVYYIESRGTETQKAILARARTLAESSPRSTDIQNMASELGALTYQHAFFVDPGMGEAAASF